MQPSHLFSLCYDYADSGLVQSVFRQFQLSAVDTVYAKDNVFYTGFLNLKQLILNREICDKSAGRIKVALHQGISEFLHCLVMSDTTHL